MTTAAEALQAHGFSGEALIGLSRKAADDALRRHGFALDFANKQVAVVEFGRKGRVGGYNELLAVDCEQALLRHLSGVALETGDRRIRHRSALVVVRPGGPEAK